MSSTLVVAIILSARLATKGGRNRQVTTEEMSMLCHLCISLGDGFNVFLCLLLRGNFFQFD